MVASVQSLMVARNVNDHTKVQILVHHNRVLKFHNYSCKMNWTKSKKFAYSDSKSANRINWIDVLTLSHLLPNYLQMKKSPNYFINSF